MAGIIWLASYPKSGNTWMRIFLENLLGASDRPADINAAKNFTTGESATNLFQRFTDVPVRDLEDAGIALLRPKVHEHLATLSPGNVVVKTHNALTYSCGVPLIAMEHTAGAIYVVRNPLDVAVSFADHFGMTLDQAIDAMRRDTACSITDETHVYQVFTSWSNHVASWTSDRNPQLLVVRYEDMLARPLETFSQVAHFVRPREPAPNVERAIAFSSFEQLRSQETRHGFVERSERAERFFREGRSGLWKDALSERQVKRIIRDHRSMMRTFGYIPTNA